MASRTVRIVALVVGLGLVLTGVIRTVGHTDGSVGCGPTSLHALCSRLGMALSYSEIVRHFNVPVDEVSFEDIQHGAAECGISMEGKRMTLAELQRTHQLGILHFSEGHFVALLGYSADGIEIADPIALDQTDSRMWSSAELSRYWDGKILVVDTNHVKTGPRQK